MWTHYQEDEVAFRATFFVFLLVFLAHWIYSNRKAWTWQRVKCSLGFHVRCYLVPVPWDKLTSGQIPWWILNGPKPPKGTKWKCLCCHKEGKK